MLDFIWSDEFEDCSLQKVKELVVTLHSVFISRVYEERTGIVPPSDQYDPLFRQLYSSSDAVMRSILGLMDAVFEDIIVPMSKGWISAHEAIRNYYGDEWQDEMLGSEFQKQLKTLVNQLLQDPFLFYVWQYHQVHHVFEIPLRSAQMYCLYLLIVQSAVNEVEGVGQAFMDHLNHSLNDNLLFAKFSDPTFVANVVPYLGVTFEMM